MKNLTVIYLNVLYLFCFMFLWCENGRRYLLMNRFLCV